jgi:hypothetical protein
LAVKPPESWTFAPGCAVRVTPELTVTELPVYGLSAAVRVMSDEIVVGSGVDAEAGPAVRARVAVARATRRPKRRESLVA